jgi:hypothetical protein
MMRLCREEHSGHLQKHVKKACPGRPGGQGHRYSDKYIATERVFSQDAMPAERNVSFISGVRAKTKGILPGTLSA